MSEEVELSDWPENSTFILKQDADEVIEELQAQLRRSQERAERTESRNVLLQEYYDAAQEWLLANNVPDWLIELAMCPADERFIAIRNKLKEQPVQEQVPE